MNTVSVFLLGRLFAGMIVGVYLARFCQRLLQTIVMQFIPMHKRLSPDSYRFQKRLMTFINIALVVGTAFLFSYGLQYAWNNYGLGVKPPQIEPLSVPKPSVQEYPKSKQLSITQLPAPSPKPIEYRDTFPKFTEQIPHEKSQPMYLQVGAYTDYHHARKAVHERNQKYHSIPFVIGAERFGTSPYKVLVGPFVTRQKAMEYSQYYKLNGFPRKINDLRLD